MTVRRICAALLAALTLHLNLAGAALVCVNAAAREAPVAAHSAMAHEHHEPAPPEHPARHVPGCDLAGQSGCCALASCSPLVFGPDVSNAVNREPTDESRPFVASTPLSRITTPDPPPPKA